MESSTALPELRIRRNDLEAEVTPKIMKWFLDNRIKSCMVEVKIKGNKPKRHQMSVLMKVAKGKFAYKFPDGRSRTPADFICLINASAYLVTFDPATRICDAEQIGGNYHYEFKI